MPDAVLLKVLGHPPLNDRGIQLDLHVHVLSWLDSKVNPDTGQERSTEERRHDLDRACSLVAKRPPDVFAQDQQLIPQVRGRVYRSPGQAGAAAPVLVFLHGGGWTVGSLDSHDSLCRRLCDETGRMVISVDYRLAPEDPFPTPLNDVVDTWEWLLDHVAGLGGDPDDMLLGGDSAGGNLTLAACQILKERGAALPKRQLLIYPGADMNCNTPSHQLFAEGAFLSQADIHWYRASYGATDWDDPRASPLLADSFAGLPPAIVITAGFDPLRDEGEQLVQKMRADGVSVEHLDAATLVHGFVNMDGAVPAADRWVGKMIDALLDD